MKQRLDQSMVTNGISSSRSQAENYIKLGYVEVDGVVTTKPSQVVNAKASIRLTATQQFVSRAGFKLASVANKLDINFKNKVVLDVGSSTGGFTDFALQHGAIKVIAVDVGTNQMHPSLRINPLVELHEQTDIRNVNSLTDKPDIVVIDVSFISLRQVLPHIKKIVPKTTSIVAMAKPQFEGMGTQKNRGVVKNERLRRDILKELENWVQKLFIIHEKADSGVLGEKGNQERFYLLKSL